MKTPSAYTRRGAPRAGDDYQDLIGAQVLVDALEHPNRYKWIRFEAPASGSLDDIEALLANDQYVYRQVKFTTRPEDEDYQVTWDWLLNRDGTSARSLLAKWSSSLRKIAARHTVHEAALITNRTAGPDIKGVLQADGSIDFGALTDDTLKARIVNEAGGEEYVTTFFGTFRFRLDQPDPSTHEEVLIERLRQLGVPYEGWLRLQKEIRTWAKFKNRPSPDSKITLRHIRETVEWRVLKDLPQSFDVPNDYAVPDSKFHNEFLNNLVNRSRDCWVMTGSPGIGKSTYLSFIVDQLRKADIPVIRHHYFLSLSDSSGDRISAQTVAETLINQIQYQYIDAAAELKAKMPNPRDLPDWIKLCGEHFAAQNKPFIVIVDGLDHVWREKRSANEIGQLFTDLLPVSPNIVLIIGTRKVPDEQLPQRLLDHMPRDQWTTLPHMNETAIREWLTAQKDRLELPENEGGRDHFLDEIAKAFAEVTEGYPLHLRYSFEALLAQGQKVWERTIKSLPRCPDGDIREYYQRLFSGLPEDSKNMLHLLAACEFRWPRSGLVECLSAAVGGEANVQEAEIKITHLLREDELGVTAYHPSLLEFIEGLAEHREVATRLLPKASSWLETTAPEFWRWGYLWITQAKARQLDPLSTKPDHEWVVNSLADGQPPSQIQEILEQSAWLALDRGDIARAMELNVLATYVDNGPEFQAQGTEALLFCQLRLNDDPYMEPRLISDRRSLTDEELATLAEFGSSAGKTGIAEICLNEFRRRARTVSERRGGLVHRDDIDLGANVDIVASAGGGSVDRVLRVLRNSNDHLEHFERYLKRLSALVNIKTLQELCTKELDRIERSHLARHIYRLAIQEGVDLRSWSLQPNILDEPIISCFSLVKNGKSINRFRSVTPDASVLEGKSYEFSGGRPDVIAFYYDVFFSTLALELFALGEFADTWKPAILENSWLEEFSASLQQAAHSAAIVIQAGTAPRPGLIYEATQNVPEPTDPYHSKEGRLASYGESALIEIAVDLHLIGVLLGGPQRIDAATWSEFASSTYFSQPKWILYLVGLQPPVLSNDAMESLLDSEVRRLSSTITQFDERYQDYAAVAKLTTIYGPTFEGRTRQYLRSAAEIVVAHNWHKDMLLHQVLDAVEFCMDKGVGDVGEWLTAVAPMVYAAGDFTDGDETSDLPVRLAGLFERFRPGTLFGFYQHLISKSEWHDANHLFQEFVDQSDGEDPINAAIASTAPTFDIERTYSDTPDDRNSEAPLREKFPPDRLVEFIEALSAKNIYSSGILNDWFTYWVKDQDRGVDVLEVFDDLYARDEHRFTLDHLYDSVFTLCLQLKGKSAAFVWLVRAHRARYGWDAYFVRKGDARQRFESVREHYADKWLEFIRITASPPHGASRRGYRPDIGLSRLALFLLTIGQDDMAVEVMDRLVKVALQRSADLPLLIPEWWAKKDGTS